MIGVVKKPRLRKALIACSLVLTTIGAFVIRILNHPQIFGPKHVRFVASDALYHMRRVYIAIGNGLRIPEYDPFMNFPEGFHCNWPPLFDQCIAGIALLLGGGNPSPQLVDTVGAVLPPVLGALTVLAVYPVARAYVSDIAAVLACAVLAVLPFHVQISVLGRPDHHVAVVFVSCLLLATTLALPRQESRAKLAALSIVTGFLLCLALNIWVGSLLLVVILAIHFAVAFALAIKRPVQRERIGTGAACAFLAAGVFLWPTATSTHWARVGHMRWDALCYFHVLLLAGCAVGFIGLCVFLPASPRAGKRDLALKAAVALLATVLAWVMYVFGFFNILTAGPSWVLKGDPMLKQVVETMPLSWRAAQENFTRLVIFFPVLLVLAARRSWREKTVESGILLVIWTVILGICTLGKERFADLFSVNAAVLVAFALDLPFRMAPQDDPDKRPTPAVTVALAILVLAVAWYASRPTVKWLQSYAYSAPRLSPQPLYDLCDWFRENTEPPRKNPDGSETPTYSIMAGWQLGNALASLANRANVANNFLGWEENREANLAPYRFAVSSSHKETEAILRSYGVRYIVIGEPVISGGLARAVDILGLRHEDFFVSKGDPGKEHFKTLPRAITSAAVVLYMGNGTGLPGFELVHQSDRKITIAGRTMPAQKIFKYTPKSITDIVEGSTAGPATIKRK
ncbi:STT3 domain-containing protein [Verrucomicrobiota bacterium]